MKYAIAALAFGLMITTGALAETVKPAKQPPVDTMTTQSVDAKIDCSKTKFAMADTCGKANFYPENPLSGMNLGF